MGGMSSETQFQLHPISVIARDARRMHRSLLADIAAWSLRNGRSVDLDVIALIVESKSEYGDDPFHWTRVSVYSHLWGNAHNYCSIRHGLTPDNIGEQMWIFLDYLADTDQLHTMSDPLHALRDPLHCYWWLDYDGKRRTDDGPKYAPCRCRVDYTETQSGDPRFRPQPNDSYR